jgi:hypothetical protein
LIEVRRQEHGNAHGHCIRVDPIGEHVQIGNPAVQRRTLLAHVLETLIGIVALQERARLPVAGDPGQDGTRGGIEPHDKRT